MAAHEYINDFFYFVVRADNAEGKEGLVCCSGVNIDRFAPLTKGRHSFASNPVIRGLQLVKHGISALALSRGAIPKFVRGTQCAGIVSTEETWYTELLVIEKAGNLSADEIIHFGAENLLEKICTGLRLERPLEGASTPGDMQTYLERLCKEG